MYKKSLETGQVMNIAVDQGKLVFSMVYGFSLCIKTQQYGTGMILSLKCQQNSVRKE